MMMSPAPGPAPARSALAEAIVAFRLPDELIRKHIHEIHQGVLAHSRYIREANFTSIHRGDLEFLFGAYDERFFTGLCLRALEGRRIRFRLATRMTNAGGKTTRFLSRTGDVSYEIAIACNLLFDGFGDRDRSIRVCGLDCNDRLEALQRIFEHELVHLVEQLCWETSNCAAARFQDIAARHFLHRAHTHNLVTRRERAADSGIRLGSRVTFVFEGQRLTGRVNRITKRATVLVQDGEGQQYSNGLRYRAYYVPIGLLEPVAEDASDRGPTSS
ncbi:MAG: SprT-like family protein [Acidobacteria bacterium]|nr:MAG: SprT-like family protein [Acidobacteriota bacterium]